MSSGNPWGSPPPYYPYQGPYPPLPPSMPQRGLSGAAIGLWVITGFGLVFFVVCLIVFFAAQPSDLEQVACTLGNQASCIIGTGETSDVIGAVGSGCFGIVGIVCGIVALVMTMNREVRP